MSDLEAKLIELQAENARLKEENDTNLDNAVKLADQVGELMFERLKYRAALRRAYRKSEDGLSYERTGIVRTEPGDPDFDTIKSAFEGEK